MKQGTDIGTQYRSVIYTYTQDQVDTALQSKEVYQQLDGKLLFQNTVKSTVTSTCTKTPPDATEKGTRDTCSMGLQAKDEM
ncbi:peptide methionine sulfoxide reductase MsrA-like [Heptranchias perlo]|uniref:peptide methionine sulfoxide reductase MsrA-like n=1 Tax=Heptranchias perlo TaxID=212740 RepID=UPI00355A6416